MRQTNANVPLCDLLEGPETPGHVGENEHDSISDGLVFGVEAGQELRQEPFSEANPIVVGFDVYLTLRGPNQVVFVGCRVIARS